MEAVQDNSKIYETGIEMFPRVYVIFDGDYYYLGFDAKRGESAFCIFRNINLCAFGVALNKEYMIKEIDFFDNRIIPYEKLILKLKEEHIIGCYKDFFTKNKGVNIGNRYLYRRFRKIKLALDNIEVTYESEIPEELSLSFTNKSLVDILNNNHDT